MFIINTVISGEIQHMFTSKDVAGLVSSWLTVPRMNMVVINMNQSEKFREYQSNSSHTSDSE